MALTADDYLNQLREWLPKGPAWFAGEDNLLERQLSAWAQELARVDAEIDRLLNEADPRTTIELLADYERMAGLPDGCVSAADGLSARRSALLTRLTSIGGQSIAYYMLVAAQAGFTITVSEYHVKTCMDTCMYPNYGFDWNFAFSVNAPAQTVRTKTCMDDCMTPLAIWGNALLECLISRLKPAHTTAIFSYGP